MKKPTNDIDLLFQSHLQHHEVPLSDPDRLWQKINIQKKDKSRGLIFLFVFLLSSSVWLAYSQFSTTPLEHNNRLSITSTIEKPSKANQLGATAIIPSQSNQPISSLTASTNSISEDTDVLQEPLSTNSSILTNWNNNSNNNFKKQTLKSSSTKNNNHSSAKTGGGGGSSDDGRLQNPIGSSTQSDLLGINSDDTPIESEESIRVSNQTRLENLEKPNSLTAISALSISMLSIQLPEVALLPRKSMMKKCVVGKSNFNPFVDINTTLAAPLESLSLNPGSIDQSQFLSSWQERFDPLTSIAAGVSIGNEWSNGIGASVGIEYQRMESQYKATQTITERTTIYDPMAYFFFDDNDEIVWVGDSVTSVTTYDRTVAHANTTTLLNIPLHISYNLIDRGPWKIKAVAGGILNLSVQYRGRYLQPDQSLLIIDDTNQDGIVTPRLGVGIEAGFDFGYLLGGNWEVYASPRYRFNQNSYWHENAALSLTRDYVGLRSGIRYHF